MWGRSVPRSKVFSHLVIKLIDFRGGFQRYATNFDNGIPPFLSPPICSLKIMIAVTGWCLLVLQPLGGNISTGFYFESEGWIYLCEILGTRYPLDFIFTLKAREMLADLLLIMIMYTYFFTIQSHCLRYSLPFKGYWVALRTGKVSPSTAVTASRHSGSARNSSFSVTTELASTPQTLKKSSSSTVTTIFSPHLSIASYRVLFLRHLHEKMCLYRLLLSRDEKS